MSSVFSKIIKNELPAIKVYETDKTLAIMDIYPIQSGQVLVFPKKEVPTVWDLDEDGYQDLMMSVKQIALVLREAYSDKKIGFIIEGLEVTDHAHVKIFPFSSAQEFHASPQGQASSEELAHIAKRIFLNKEKGNIN